jgi:hypothetical protein
MKNLHKIIFLLLIVFNNFIKTSFRPSFSFSKEPNNSYDKKIIDSFLQQNVSFFDSDISIEETNQNLKRIINGKIYQRAPLLLLSIIPYIKKSFNASARSTNYNQNKFIKNINGIHTVNNNIDDAKLMLSKIEQNNLEKQKKIALQNYLKKLKEENFNNLIRLENQFNFKQVAPLGINIRPFLKNNYNFNEKKFKLMESVNNNNETYFLNNFYF